MRSQALEFNFTVNKFFDRLKSTSSEVLLWVAKLDFLWYDGEKLLEKESDHEEKASYTGYLPCAGRDPGLGSGRRRFPVRIQECCPARDGTFLSG